MSERELRQLFASHTREIDAYQRARIRQLEGIERELFKVLVERIMSALDKGDGVIKTSRGSASINRLVNEAFNAIERSELKAFYKESLADLFKILGSNDVYNDGLRTTTKVGDKRYKEIREQVDRIMRKSIGIDDKGRAIKGGYFDSLLTTVSRNTRNEVQQIINAGVNAGTPIGKLTRQIEITVKGTQQSPGVLSTELQSHIFDTYQRFDRVSNDTYAAKLGLEDFIYAGGLIETSREFCIKKDGKVFSRKQAETEWPKDPTLPKTTKEKQTGVVAGYNPTSDLGRWRCRHRTRFISKALAEQLKAA